MSRNISSRNLYPKISEFPFLFNHMLEFLHFYFSCSSFAIYATFIFPWVLHSSSRLIASTCCRFCRLCRFRRRCQFQHCPLCLNQHCFVSVSPWWIFLPGLDSPAFSPCSSNNMRYWFSPMNLCCRFFPLVGIAATTPMSRPAVFFIKPWTIQSRDPGNAVGSHPSLRDAVPLEGTSY